MIKAEIIADSINKQTRDRITTFVVNFPRIVLSELNTHRALSKNSASSRAIPFEKMLEMVTNNPFVPIKFQKDHKGMQGTEYYEGKEHEQCAYDWLHARNTAIDAALHFEYPVTKQLRNRLLEPFMWHKVIITATEFENFFALRAHPDAEIHIADLAYKMLEAYNTSIPKELNEGEWHIPFGDKIDESKLYELADKERDLRAMSPVADKEIVQMVIDKLKVKIAIARCARISYANFEGKDDYEADIKLCDRLFGSTPKHLSPTEHVAQALSESKRVGNFKGWKQYRYFFPEQNLTDSRVKKY